MLSEIDIVKKTGLARNAVRRVRVASMTEGEQWHKESGPRGRIVYLPEGVAVLEKALGVTLAEGEPAAAENGAVEADTAPVAGDRVFVVTTVPMNPRILVARDKASGEEVRIRVATQRHWMPGMEILERETCREHETLFGFRGALPRRKGFRAVG